MELVCRLLEVSRSGYYEWLGRKPSLRRQKDQELKRRLLSLHQRYPALGLDSLYHLIRPQLSCSRKRIHRLMNEMNISSTRRRAYKATTNSRHAHPIAPNLLARRFSFDKPDTAWVGDITYIPTGEGWLYCAVVKDLCTKQIVGYAFSDRIDTNLTLAALGMAVRRRKPLPGLIFHSDRGVQYAAYAYRQRLASLGIRQSMSRKGDPYDNAVAENFFSCLKCECVHLRHFASRAQAMADVFAYIETFYNPVRPHSSIGWLYCAVVKDLCTKQIVGYAFSDRIDTNLTLAALGMAVRRRKPLPGLIFHSDRGVQYAAYAYRQRLASLGIRQSMSRKGDPYDNAVAENFFSCLKCECVHLRHFASRAQAMADVFAYIETFYNPVRPHSSIGWRPPDAFARALSEHPAA